MNPIILGVGMLFVVLGLVGVIGPHVSARRKAMVERLDTPWYAGWLIVAIGAVYVVAGLLDSTRWMLVGFVAMWGVALLSRSLMRKVEDPPPMVARMREQTLNPLSQLVHPIRSARQFADVFRIRRNLREQRAWEERNGLRKP